jgi:hypothetical protein
VRPHSVAICRILRLPRLPRLLNRFVGSLPSLQSGSPLVICQRIEITGNIDSDRRPRLVRESLRVGFGSVGFGSVGFGSVGFGSVGLDRCRLSRLDCRWRFYRTAPKQVNHPPPLVNWRLWIW